jgi:hypothetical protein
MKFLVRISIAFLSLSGIYGNMSAQDQKTWQWVSQIGGRSWDMTCGIAIDPKGSLYVAGSYSDTLYADRKKILTAGNQDIFIAYVDEKGNIKNLWSGGGKGRDQATCIAAANKNNVIVGGWITGDVAFDDLYDRASGNRLFLLNLNSKGKFVWISTLVPVGDASLYLTGTDNQGRTYAAGVFSGSLTSGNNQIISNGKKDIFLARLSSDGTIEKLVSFGGEENDIPTALSVSDSGKIVLAGTVGKAFVIDSLNLVISTKNAKSNAFIVLFEENFKALWETQITGEEFGQVASVQQDKLGNIYAAGSFNLRLWPGDTLMISQGYSDGFLLKYRPDGRLLWGRSFGSWYYDYASQLTIDNLGGVIITGSMGDTVVIDNITVNPDYGENSALAIQFSPYGRVIWADCISGNGRNFSDGITIDPEGNLYIAGAFRSSFRKESDALVSRGDQDVFLAKYYNCGEGKGIIQGNFSICPGTSTELTIGKEFSRVVWNDTLTNQYYLLAQKPGIYWATMIDKKGCRVTDTVEVSLAPQTDFFLGNDIGVPVETMLELKAPEKFSGYRWQDNSDNSTFLARAIDGEPGVSVYWLSAVDSLGCIVNDTIAVDFYLTPQWVDLNQVVLTTYPNPVKNWLNWSITTDQPCQLFMEVTDDNGKVIINQHIDQYLPGSTLKTDFSDISSGIYYFRLKNGTGQSSESVCIIRQ